MKLQYYLSQDKVQAALGDEPAVAGICGYSWRHHSWPETAESTSTTWRRGWACR